MSTDAAHEDTPAIIIRKMGFTFEDLPRHWFGGDPIRTHVVNGLHFVFPAGERFFIRSVKRFRDQVPDELQERIRGFFGQEAHHQAEHKRAFEAIEKQGYDVQSFLEWYEKLAYDEIEPRVEPITRLAVTAALEHYTAVLGEFALESDSLDDCHPLMHQLLKWHACEEIEHKAVAFDVLQHVDPSYRRRLSGFAIASVVLLFFWGSGTVHMLRQESARQDGRRPSTRRGLSTLASMVRNVAPRLLDYLKPSFHPNDHDNYELARSYLSKIGRLEA